MIRSLFILTACVTAFSLNAAVDSTPATAPAVPTTATRIVVTYDSPQIPAGSPDLLPKTIYRSGPNMARIEGVVSAETGHRILVVTNSPHLWMADLDAGTGEHTVDDGPEIGADVPIFPVKLEALEELQFGNELAYFQKRNAKLIERTRMLDRVCDRQDIEAEDHTLVGCFEPMTGRPVSVGLRVGELVIGVNYLEYDRNAPVGADTFTQPAKIKFTEKPHQDETKAAQ